MCGWDAETLATRLEAIGTTLTEIYQHAEQEGITTEKAAEAIARSRLS